MDPVARLRSPGSARQGRRLGRPTGSLLARPKGTGRSGRLFRQTVQVARTVEFDERLAAAAGPDLASGDQDVTPDRSAVGRPPSQLALIEGWAGPRHHACAPLRIAGGILPAIDRRGGQGATGERHVEEREAHMSSGHARTIAGRAPDPRVPDPR